jgi:hypothetical protein
MEINNIEDINKRFLDALEASTYDECDIDILEIKAASVGLALHTLSDKIKRGMLIIENGESVAATLNEVHDQFAFKFKTMDKKTLVNRLSESYEKFKRKFNIKSKLT